MRNIRRLNSPEICPHPYCRSQSINDTLGTMPINYSCLHPFQGNGIYDIHGTNNKRAEDFLKKGAQLNFIFDSVEEFQELPKKFKDHENCHFQFFFKKEPNPLNVDPLLLYKERVQFLLDPLTHSSSDIFQFYQKTFFPYSSTLTGRYFHLGWSQYQGRDYHFSLSDTFQNGGKPKLSVIIPHFNHPQELHATITYLLKTELPKENFEIVIIDDHSSQKPLNKTIEELKKAKVSFQMGHIKKEHERTLGDNEYSAGVARNQGADIAQSDKYLFLDADILCQGDILKTVSDQLDQRSYIQAKRWHLKPEVSEQIKSKPFSSPLSLGMCQSRSGNYFEDFQDNPETWSKLSYPWKYCSSFCFAIHRDLFWKLGGFSSSFCFYGFEDVELGYRAYKSGAQLSLLDENVFALYHEKTRSEYENTDQKKQDLLSKSANLFFVQNPSQEVFEGLEFYF